MLLSPPKGSDSVEQFEFYYRINRYLIEFGGMARLMGIFPERPWVNKAFAVSASIAVFCFLIPHLYASATQPMSITQTLESIGIHLVAINCAGKTLVIICKRDAISRQEEIWRNLWKEIVLPEQLLELGRFAKKGKLLTFGWIIGMLIISIIYLAAPVFVSFRNNFANGTELPVPVGVEFNSTFTLSCVYAGQIFGASILYLSVTGMDSICPVLLLHACGHLKVLQMQLYDIEKHNKAVKISTSLNENGIILAERNPSMIYASIASSFRVCMRRHQAILEACAELENTYNLMGLVEAVCVAWHLCIAGVALLLVPEGSLKFAVHLLCALYHLFIYCWPADDLMTQSLEVANATFSIPWYHCPPGLRIDALIMIQRAQKCCQFTAGGYFVMSLEAYTALVSNGLSTFAVLRTVM